MKIVPRVLLRGGVEWCESPVILFRVMAEPKSVMVIATEPPANGLFLSMGDDGVVMACNAPLREILAHPGQYRVEKGQVVWLKPPVPIVHANGDRYDFRSVNLVPGDGAPFDDDAASHWKTVKGDATGGDYTPGFHPGAQCSVKPGPPVGGKVVGYYSKRGTYCSSQIEADHMTKAGK